MDISILQREPMTVVGWKRKFRSILATDEGSSSDIGDLWMNVFRHDEVSKLPGSLGRPMWGVIWADPVDQRSHPGELNYLAGVPFSSVPELPEGMSSYQVPGGTYAMITHKGPLSGLKETIGFIHKWVDENGYAEPPNWCDLELYDERFFQEGPDQALDYFINIVPAAANQPAPNVTIEQTPDKGSEDTGSRSHEFKRRTDKLRLSRETKPGTKSKNKSPERKQRVSKRQAKKPTIKKAAKATKKAATKSAKKPVKKPVKSAPKKKAASKSPKKRKATKAAPSKARPKAKPARRRK